MISQNTGAPLNKVPASRWVRDTVARMERAGATDVHDWTRFWDQSYIALGGRSKSGAKGCPRTAAYALWSLGRLRYSTKNFLSLSIADIDSQIGKNAAYAIIAV